MAQILKDLCINVLTIELNIEIYYFVTKNKMKH